MVNKTGIGVNIYISGKLLFKKASGVSCADACLCIGESKCFDFIKIYTAVNAVTLFSEERRMVKAKHGRLHIAKLFGKDIAVV